jgi:hypothetical protein
MRGWFEPPFMACLSDLDGFAATARRIHEPRIDGGAAR